MTGRLKGANAQKIFSSPPGIGGQHPRLPVASHRPCLGRRPFPAEFQIQQKIPETHQHDRIEIRQVEVYMEHARLQIEQKDTQADTRQTDRAHLN